MGAHKRRLQSVLGIKPCCCGCWHCHCSVVSCGDCNRISGTEETTVEEKRTVENQFKDPIEHQKILSNEQGRTIIESDQKSRQSSNGETNLSTYPMSLALQHQQQLYIMPSSQLSSGPPLETPLAIAISQPALQQPFGSLSVQQELNQQFRFSTHPRPSVVTSINPSLVPTGLSPQPTIWEPKPFISPVDHSSKNQEGNV
jgi:hypothetical protein